MDVLNNAEYFMSIHKAKKPLKLHSNAGCVMVTEKGCFRGNEVWHQPKKIPNILSWKTLKKRHHVTYNSKDRDVDFKVYTDNGIVEHVPYKSGLYLDLKDCKDAPITWVTFVRGNIKGYTKRQVDAAIKACCLQTMFGHPSGKTSRA